MLCLVVSVHWCKYLIQLIIWPWVTFVRWCKGKTWNHMDSKCKINCKIIRLSPSMGYHQVQLFLSTTLNPLISMHWYLHTSILKSAKILKSEQSRAVKHIKISCLPWDSLLNSSWHQWNIISTAKLRYLKNVNKQLLKTQASKNHLLARWKFTQRTFLFYFTNTQK